MANLSQADYNKMLGFSNPAPPKPKPTISLVLQLSHDHQISAYCMRIDVDGYHGEIKLTLDQFDYLHRMCKIEPSLRILKRDEERPKD